MTLFAMAISITLATVDHLRLRDQAIHNQQDKIEHNEIMVKYALEATEKAYTLFGNNIAIQMKESSDYLLDKYDENPSFDEWDFDALKKLLSYDIYIIDSSNRITHSTFAKDVGLDFEICCKKLADVLDERRSSGDFAHDGLDIEQQSGILKKYSYIATRDKKFVIQLGYALQDGDIFQQFNFFDSIDELKQQSPSINEINILNIGGLSLRDSINNPALTTERRKAFEQTLATKQTTEFRSHWGTEPAIYRYVHYESKYDLGSTKTKVLEIIYNENNLQAILRGNQQTFISQLIAVLLITIILSLIISRWVARPMHLAFHDSLTGLKNRAAFDELLEAALANNKGTIALLMIDLDNFKAVNDDLGHDQGDVLLRSVAHSIRSVAVKGDVPIRLGGDEFVMMMSSTSKTEAEQTANRIIEAAKQSIAQEFKVYEEKITLSIGIALAPDDGIDPETLCKRADIALYSSKEKGKDQYQFYDQVAGRSL
nr:GGDEF domain-containing protein [Cohnella sp. WQ 127256]